MFKLSNFVSHTLLFSFCMCFLQEYHTKTKPTRIFLYTFFIIIGFYAILGVIKSADCIYPDQDEHWKRMYDAASFLIPIIALPSLVAEVWISNYMIKEQLAWIHLVTGLIQIILKYENNLSKDDMDVIVGINAFIFLFGVGVAYEDYYASLSGLTFIMAHFGTPHRAVLHYRTSSENLYNYSLVGFTYFAFMSSQISK